MKNTESIADKCNVELSIGVGQRVPTANIPDVKLRVLSEHGDS